MNASSQRSKRHSDRRFTTFLAMGLAFALAHLSGCTGDAEGDADRPATTKVSGKVTYKGSPVDGATVVLAPTATGGKAASGLTGSDGMFELRTFEDGDGAVPGDYKVSIQKLEQSAVTQPDQDSPDYVDPATQTNTEKSSGPKHLLPQKYSKADTSGLTAKVPAEGKVTDLNFDLAD